MDLDSGDFINQLLGFNIRKEFGSSVTYIQRADNYGRMIAGLPDLVFTIQGVNVTLTPRDYAFLDISRRGTPMYASGILSSDALYVDSLKNGLITPKPANYSEAIPVFILGNVFLRKFYTIFKFDTEPRPGDDGKVWQSHKVGLALANRDPGLAENLTTSFPTNVTFIFAGGAANRWASCPQLLTLVAVAAVAVVASML